MKIGSVLSFVLCVSGMVSRAQTLLYSEDFNGSVGSQPADWSVFNQNGSFFLGRNDGNSEYEHRVVSSPLPSDLRVVSHYNNPDETDRGVWRDSTTEAIMRFSQTSSGSSQTGLIVRGRGMTATGGDYYHARINGSNLQIFRFIGGTATLLQTVALPAGYGSAQDRLMRVNTENIAAIDTANVRLTVEIYKGSTAASGIDLTTTVTDTAVNAISRTGTSGMRSFFLSSSGANVRSTFDDMRVTTGHPNLLLWYDDYYNSQAVRPEVYTSPGMPHVIANRRSEFNSVAAGNSGIHVIGFDAETSTAAWENVVATAMVRLNTNNSNGELSGGLVLRETGVSGTANSGDYYHLALVRDENTSNHRLDLVRVNAGLFTVLDSQPLFSNEVPESANIFMEFQAVSELGGVRLTGHLSQNLDFSSAYGFINFLDASSSRLLGPGSAGFLVQGGANMVSGAINFDTFTVQAVIPEPSSFVLGLCGLMLLRTMRRNYSR